MGGRALQHLGVQRIAMADALEFSEHLRETLGVVPIPPLPDKTDCGDIDVLVPAGTDPRRLLPQGTDFTANGGVVSAALPWKGSLVQVDFIPTSPGPFGTTHALVYYTYDVGMYLGQMAVWQGLTFATEGLRLRHDPEVPWSEDILFESDPEKTFGHLGYGPLPEIRTRQDLWAYVLSSPDAHPDIFATDALNARNRTRNSHRPLWIAFQEWLATRPPAERPCPPRSTHEQAYQRFVGRYPALKEERDWQRYRWQKTKENAYLLGIGAVEFHDPHVGREEAGEVVRRLQSYLPEKSQRAETMNTDGPAREALIALARQKAGEILAELRRKL